MCGNVDYTALKSRNHTIPFTVQSMALGNAVLSNAADSDGDVDHDDTITGENVPIP